jgi:hemolysin D
MLAAITVGRVIARWRRLPGLHRLTGRSQEQRNLDGQYGEYQAPDWPASTPTLPATRRSCKSTQLSVRKLEQTAPIARQRATDFRRAGRARPFISQARLPGEGAGCASSRKAIWRRRRSRLNGVGGGARRGPGSTRRRWLPRRGGWLSTTLNEGEQKASTLGQELVKAESRGRLMTLTAPVDGTVQQLAVHTVGGVVTPAQALMVIVPLTRRSKSRPSSITRTSASSMPARRRWSRSRPFPSRGTARSRPR